MPIEPIENNGLRVPLTMYRKLKAFQSGGYYWDHQPQQLVRQTLGEFLPQVEMWVDAEGSFGWYRRDQAGKERLFKSKPLGGAGIPPKTMAKLEAALEEFTRAAQSEETQPHNRELIGQFRLPNPECDPELYRVHGPPWNRKLEILWGCEKTADSSLPPGTALRNLRADRFYFPKQFLWMLLGGLALLLLLWLLALLSSAVFRGCQRLTNNRPDAHVSIASSDIPARRVQLNLAGTDSDGKVVGYEVDWGDGTNQFVPADQNHLAKQYTKEGDYTVKVTAVDDLHGRSIPIETPLKFDHEAKERAAEAARLAAQKAVDDAKRKDLEAKHQREFEAKKSAAEEQARQEAESLAIKQAAEKARMAAQKETESRLAKEAADAELSAREQAAREQAAREQAAVIKQSSQKQTPNDGGVPQASNDFKDVTTGRNVKILSFQKPTYPAKARALNISGMVQAEFTVDTSGKPKNIRVVNQINGEYFVSAVTGSIKKARFEPAIVDGQAIEQKVAYQISFKMME